MFGRLLVLAAFAVGGLWGASAQAGEDAVANLPGAQLNWQHHLPYVVLRSPSNANNSELRVLKNGDLFIANAPHTDANSPHPDDNLLVLTTLHRDKDRLVKIDRNVRLDGRVARVTNTDSAVFVATRDEASPWHAPAWVRLHKLSLEGDIVWTAPWPEGCGAPSSFEELFASADGRALVICTGIESKYPAIVEYDSHGRMRAAPLSAADFSYAVATSEGWIVFGENADKLGTLVDGSAQGHIAVAFEIRRGKAREFPIEATPRFGNEARAPVIGRPDAYMRGAHGEYWMRATYSSGSGDVYSERNTLYVATARDKPFKRVHVPFEGLVAMQIGANGLIGASWDCCDEPSGLLGVSVTGEVTWFQPLSGILHTAYIPETDEVIVVSRTGATYGDEISKGTSLVVSAYRAPQP